MQKIDLNGKWHVNFGQGEVEVKVPAAVETILPDKSYPGPFIYSREFTIDQVESDQSYVVEFGGVSYKCDVYCNDQLITSHEGFGILSGGYYRCCKSGHK